MNPRPTLIQCIKSSLEVLSRDLNELTDEELYVLDAELRRFLSQTGRGGALLPGLEARARYAERERPSSHPGRGTLPLTPPS